MKTQSQADPLVESYHRVQRAAAVLETAAAKSIAHTELTMSQFNTLRILAERGPLAQRDIAEQLLKTGGNVTLVVDHLSNRRLVVRNRDTVDRRVIYVALTEEGRQLYNELAPIHDTVVKQCLQRLLPDELAQLTRSLSILAPERARATRH